MRAIVADGRLARARDRGAGAHFRWQRYAPQMEVPLRIESAESALTVSWEDGPEHVISAETLRAACPCAACREPEGAERISQLLGGLLAVTIGDVSIVGDYALSIGFGPDGHATGIFPYPLLKSLGEAAA